MRRQVIVGIAGGVGALVAIGALVFATQQGLFGDGAQRLLMSANQAAARQRWAEARAALEQLLTTFPDSPVADDALLRLGEIQEAEQRFAEARASYQTLLQRFPESPLVDRIQEHLGRVNVALLFSKAATEQDVVYEVRPGDTLGRIAARFATTVEFIKKANGLTNDVIRPQQRLKVHQGRFSIVVDKSQGRLLLTDSNQFVKVYQVATGKDQSTPVGTFKIVNKIPDPVWYTQGAVVPPDSPENILGTRWMGFDKSGYGIHGTDDPTPVTEQASAGCVRMTNRDVEELFSIVPLGTEVTVVD